MTRLLPPRPGTRFTLRTTPRTTPRAMPRATPRTGPRTGAVLSGCALSVVTPLAVQYVVQPGDTVSEIAAEHGTTVGRVVGANDLPAGGDQIYAGERLRIPAAHRRGHAPAPARPAPNAEGGGSTDDRRIVWHRVGPGDTMTGIAVRYHAWTDELVAANGGDTTLVVGERVKVPVVVSRARADAGGAGDGAAARRTGGAASQSGGTVMQRMRQRLDRHRDPSRTAVRRIIARTSRRHGVDPQLALAVSWQEAGWQQHHLSPDLAIGAMQVIPSTGEWVDGMVGHDLDLMHVRDNVTAGVVLLDHLTDVATTRRGVAGYYQGLAGVREHGMYDDTRAYVRNVLALRRAFERGDYPG